VIQWLWLFDCKDDTVVVVVDCKVIQWLWLFVMVIQWLWLFYCKDDTVKGDGVSRL
jgi:hypothetical protein